MRTSLAAAALAVSLVLLSARAPAQNLVPNPGFEAFSSCPSSFAQMNRCNAWSTPTAGTPDYFHACSTGPVDVPVNAYGSQAAHGGSAYVGCICYNSTTGQFREYVEAKLTSPLVANQTYDVSFWVSLADKSRWQIADIGAYFSVGSVGFINNLLPLPYTPQVANPTTNILSNAAGWTKISGTFTAAGGETHVVIGNFKNNTATNVQSRTGSNPWGYYYVDDVTVTAASSGPIVATNHIIGWSDLQAPATTSFIDIQDVDNNCKPAKTVCKPVVPLRAPIAWAGGTAYDPRYQEVWVSDGNVVADYFLAPKRACKQRCPPFKATKLDPQALVSGLAHADRLPRLFQLATRPGYMEIVTYRNDKKCPYAPKGCKRLLPSKAVAAGLAYDEVRDYLYISVSTRLATGAWSTLLWVSPASKPCQPFCEARLFTCSNSPVLGLAYDACGRKLYATDGRLTQTVFVVDPKQCKLKLGPCCKKQILPVYRGLAVVPGWKKSSAGKPCTSKPCATCPSMVAGCDGDPGLGNAFKLDIRNAPSGAFAMLFLKAAPCGNGIVLPSPPFCGVWYAFPMFFQFPTVVLPPPTPCGGTHAWTLNIPAWPVLCGRTFCAQWFLVCLKGAFGVGVSNAVEFTITTS